MDIVKGFAKRLANLDGESPEDIYRDYLRMVKGNDAITDEQAFDMLMLIVNEARDYGFDEGVRAMEE